MGQPSVEARARRPAVGFANAIEIIRLDILLKIFPEQILTHEKQIIMEMFERWIKELVFIGIRY